MERKDQRFQMMFPESELEAIEQYREKHRLPSTAEAILQLCRMALTIEKPKTVPRYPVKVVTVAFEEEQISTAKHLRALRYQADLSQSELARLTGLSQSAISNWESGGSVPRSGDYRKLIAACEEHKDNIQ